VRKKPEEPGSKPLEEVKKAAQPRHQTSIGPANPSRRTKSPPLEDPLSSAQTEI
jgi:hypothetical protein